MNMKIVITAATMTTISERTMANTPPILSPDDESGTSGVVMAAEAVSSEVPTDDLGLVVV